MPESESLPFCNIALIAVDVDLEGTKQAGSFSEVRYRTCGKIFTILDNWPLRAVGTIQQDSAPQVFRF